MNLDRASGRFSTGQRTADGFHRRCGNRFLSFQGTVSTDRMRYMKIQRAPFSKTAPLFSVLLCCATVAVAVAVQCDNNAMNVGKFQADSRYL